MATWPDTRNTQCPRDHLYGSARWLLGRHKHLARVLDRVPGGIDEDGDPDLDLLAAALTARDIAADGRGPVVLTAEMRDAVQAIGVMSHSERTRLRILASFSVLRVPVSALDFRGLDDEGWSLFRDWAIAVEATA